MNFKKVLSIASVASLAVVGLASCGKKKKSNVEEYTGNVNVAATYADLGYVTYGRGKNNLGQYTTIDGRTLSPNVSLAPVWQDIATNMNVTIQDAAPKAGTTQESIDALITANYKGYNDRSADLLQVAGTYTDEITNGNILNLLPYIESGKMPNLKKWLDNHQAVKQQLTIEVGDTEGIYYTPYFDGIDQNEQQFNMNIDIVKALLDPQTAQTEASLNYYNKANTGDYDTTYTYSSFAYNKPFIKSLTNQEVAVARQKQTGLNTKKEARIDDNDLEKYGDVKYVADKITVTIPEGQDIITRMNNLQVKNGKTLVECLKTYLTEVYGNYVGEGKLLANLSDIFISTSACYNTDELIALLRCVKANPGWLNGNANATMIPFFPRTGQANRVRRLISFMQIFGLRGLEGECDRYWINADGKLTDGRSQEGLLHGLTLINKLQQDKLFPETAGWTTDGSSETGDFRETQLKQGYAFMCNDMSNVAAFNNDAETTEAKKAANKCYNITGVLPPLSKWGFTYDNGTNKSSKGNSKVVGANTTDNYSYTRFSEDNRSLKDGGWGAVASIANDESKLNKVLEIMDYMYTPEGSVLECFGYNAQASDDQKSKAFDKRDAGATAAKNYKGKSDEYLAQDASGNYFVKVKQAFIDEKTRLCAGTWHNYMTQYWGSCIGIGNIRTNYLESQLTSPRQKMGVTKLMNAMGVGAYYLAQTAGENYLSSVRTKCIYTSAQKAANDANKDLTTFWNQAKGSPYYTIAFSGWGSVTEYPDFASVKAKYDAYNNSYVKNTATQWELEYDTTDQFSFISWND